MAKNVSRCGAETDDGCGNLQPTIKKVDLATITAEWVDKDKKAEKMSITVSPEMILKIFKRISDEDISFMGFSPIYSRPEWMICQVLSVPPPSVRPSVKHDAQQRSEDDLTHILCSIIKTNKILHDKIQNNAPANIIDDNRTTLQYFIATQVDNKIPGVAPVAQRSGRPLKSIKERLNGKGGRMRGNLMAKRVDFSARSVITADPNISISELGIPMKIAKNITKPVYVNKLNIDFLTKLVRNGPDIHPGAKLLEKDGQTITLRYCDRESIVLEEGNVVHRHMMNGDAVLFNRQPSLHRMSMMCHIAKIMKRGDTFRMNVADTKPYNADFDGDEMNLHMPQDPEAEAELRYLAAVPYQIISPANHKSIIGVYQDSMLGAFQFTRENVRFNARETMNLLMMFNGVNESHLLETLEKNGSMTCFEILTQILPPLSLKYKTNSFNDKTDNEVNSNKVLEIRNGQYIRGQMDKGTLADGTKGLLHRICNDYGNMASAKFIDDLQNIVTEYMKTSSFSVGVSDLISDQATNQEILAVITKKKQDVKDLIDQIQLGVFENNTGKTNEDEFENQVNNILNKATSELGKIGREKLGKNNRFVIMVNAGSKGQDLNISQMISCIGQQNVDGKRIPYGFENRTLPHFSKFDDSPLARGFVESSYIKGLSPQELFFHAVSGRIGLIDTAVKTSTTGYIQRKLIKALEDLMVDYGFTVRTNKKKIIQFSYGDDNIDTIKVETQQMYIVNMSTQEIYDHLNVLDFKSKQLATVFTPEALKRQKSKKEQDFIQPKCAEYTAEMIQRRDDIVKYVFGNKADTTVNCPVAFSHIINNIQGQMNITSASMVDITLGEAFKLIELTYANLNKLGYCAPTKLFETLYKYYLSPKDLLIVKRFNRNALIVLLEAISTQYKRSIVAPGEMVGMLAGQSIGEVSTQMSVPFYSQHKIVMKHKVTGAVEFKSIVMGEFCDGLIEANPTLTFNTGHENSVETLLDESEHEYYIMGVSEEERTSWNQISHVSKHPVNGQMMKVLTRSGRVVETTTSHSHLIRKDNKVVPIVGANMIEGMRIPVCRHIENSFVVDTYKSIKLDELFGWFIGAYLAEGNLNYNEISITNVSRYYIENTKKIATMFGKGFRVTEKEGEYGQSITTKFNCEPLAKILLNTCGNGSFVKKVPDFAFTAPDEFKRGMFRGYFDGDGNFQCDQAHHQIRCCSRSEQLIKDLALILNYFDIVGNLKSEHTRGSWLYHLNIPSKYAKVFQTKIGTNLHADKLENLVRYIERSDAKFLSEQIDKINGMGEIVAHCGKMLQLPGQSRTYGFFKNKESIGRRTLEKYYQTFKAHEKHELISEELGLIEQALSSGVIWDEIVHIEYYTPDQNNYVYDFTIPGNQTFVTDYGVMVHNTLNSVTYETEIIVKNKDGHVRKTQIGDFIENKIKIATKTQYYPEKDTTYSELDDYMEIPSCTENGEILWKRIEAVTRHPVINIDGTNTMLKITTKEQREIIVTKAKSVLKLIDGKVIPINGDELKVGDYMPVSKKQIDFTEIFELNLKSILLPTEYVYTSEVEAAAAVMHEGHWWKKHSGKTFKVPHRRSDVLYRKVHGGVKKNCKTKTTLATGCVYMLNTNMNDYQIPEIIPLDYNFGYLIGAYAAEGCMTRFQVSISNNDIAYFAPIQEFCERYNLTTKIYRHEDKNQVGWTSQDIRIYNTVLCRLLEYFCGKLSHNKFVSNEIIFSNKQCLLGFMDAYIGGDGCVGTRESPDIIMSSVSKELLIDVQQILNILGCYGKLAKYKKPESNNRGSHDIKQLYNLIVRNYQAQKLAPMLNIKLAYKQENLKKIMAHNYQFEYSRKDQCVPNEIDGVIVMTPRDEIDYCYDVYFDQVIFIEEVPNTTNYAYDLTISDTRTFNIYNGLALNDTFHSTGSKSNVTRGVPRIEEILSLSEYPKNPSLTVYLREEDEKDKDKVQSIMCMLEHTRLNDIVKSIEMCFDPEDKHEGDQAMIEQYKLFENMVNIANMGSSQMNVPGEKSKWILRIQMDKEIMLDKNITMDDINFTLSNCYKDQIQCVYSDYNSDNLVFRVRMVEVAKNKKLTSPDQSDHIYMLKNFQDQLLQNVVIRGIKGINQVSLRKIKDNVFEKNGAYKKEDIWVVDTVGTNLLEILSLDFIDPTRTISNDIREVFNVYGIEAARQILLNELVEVVSFGGVYINYHNYSVLCDRMTFTSKMISISRFGINSDDTGPITKASFEETPELFLQAARHAELDLMTGVSANIMCGQEGFYGTSCFQVYVDFNKMINSVKYNPVKEDEMIADAMSNAGESTLQQKLVDNNVAHINPQFTMNDDEDYNPGF